MIQYLKAGTMKRVHVDRRILAQNLKTGANAPAVTVQTSKGAYKCRAANILGYSEMRQAGTFARDSDGEVFTLKPLKCGARVWVETMAAIEVIT